MTDKEKFRAEIERLRGSFKVLSVASPSRDTTLEYIAKAALCKQILSFIDSMQEEPTTSVWHDASEKPIMERPLVLIFKGEYENFKHKYRIG